MSKEDRFYLAYVTFGILVFVAFEYRRTDWSIFLNVQIIFIAICLVALITVVIYTLLKVWERRTR